MICVPLSDVAVLARWDEGDDAMLARRVLTLADMLRRSALPGVLDVVPAYRTVAVHFDPAQVGGPDPFARVQAWMERESARVEAAPLEARLGREWSIPVYYGGEDGPDLAQVAARVGLSEAEVVRLHAEATYTVRAIGFSPGFPYLSGLPERLQVPRRATPRLRVPAGSVAIAANQAGIYPQSTPGGWNLLGRTDRPLFDPAARPPALLQIGDRVRFVPTPAATAQCHVIRDIAREPVGEGAGESGAADGGDGRMEVVRAGWMTTVQDLGRPGWQAQGVSVGGAVDGLAARVANAMVGNADEAAVLECTWQGPVLRFEEDAVVALAGAHVIARLETPDGLVDLPALRPWRVRAGEILSLERWQGGARAYLAVAGGWAVPRVLGSASTHVRSALGGWAGRALRSGDRLSWHRSRGETAPPAGGWSVAPEVLAGGDASASLQGPGHRDATEPLRPRRVQVRVMDGPQADWFTDEAREHLTQLEFLVDANSDRMGLRLRGGALKRAVTRELASEGVAFGSVQVPPDGQPVVLLADRQTLGGYPKVATVITADLPLLAQLRPGDRLRFVRVTRAEALESWLEREKVLATLRAGLAGLRRSGTAR